VSYVPQGFGVALVVDRDGDGPGRRDRGRSDGAPPDDGPGLLWVGDAVVTLEIPGPDGRRSTLSWDPAEVALDPLVA
jgi:hypothetical protein